MPLPTPHGDKLRAALENEKLPPSDATKLEHALSQYNIWIANLTAIPAGAPTALADCIALLNEYRLFIDLELIFDSSDDFLYRQKGQLKLDNTVIEEFLPHLLLRVIGSPALTGFALGPRPCYSALFFTSRLSGATTLPGIQVRTKDQDFAISRAIEVRAAFSSTDGETPAAESVAGWLGYLCAECKTNLDKTMFQEAIATAHDVKTAVPGAKYFLLCDWLDMIPISTAGTDIDEVLILRKSRRVGAQIRSRFSSRAGRQAARGDYERFLRAHPFSADVFDRLLTHVRALLNNQDPVETDVLGRGYF